MSTVVAQADARAALRLIIDRDQTIYTNLRHVSQSGMQRVISIHIVENDRIRDVSWLIHTALDFSYDTKRNGIRINGTGMDMGYSIVYSLSRTLFDDGYALKHEWI